MHLSNKKYIFYKLFHFSFNEFEVITSVWKETTSNSNKEESILKLQTSITSKGKWVVSESILRRNEVSF